MERKSFSAQLGRGTRPTSGEILIELGNYAAKGKSIFETALGVNPEDAGEDGEDLVCYLLRVSKSTLSQNQLGQIIIRLIAEQNFNPEHRYSQFGAIDAEGRPQKSLTLNSIKLLNSLSKYADTPSELVALVYEFNHIQGLLNDGDFAMLARVNTEAHLLKIEWQLDNAEGEEKEKAQKAYNQITSGRKIAKLITGILSSEEAPTQEFLGKLFADMGFEQVKTEEPTTKVEQE